MDGERENAVEQPQHVLAMLLIQRQQHLGIRVAAKHPAAFLQSRAQLAEVVDLAIERNHRRAICTGHRLVSRRGQIDDRQPRVPKRDTLRIVAVHPGIIRATMAELAQRSLERMRIP